MGSNMGSFKQVRVNLPYLSPFACLRHIGQHSSSTTSDHQSPPQPPPMSSPPVSVRLLLLISSSFAVCLFSACHLSGSIVVHAYNQSIVILSVNVTQQCESISSHRISSILPIPDLFLTASFVTFCFHVNPNIRLSHLWCASSNFFLFAADSVNFTIFKFSRN